METLMWNIGTGEHLWGKIGTGNSSGEDRVWGTKGLGEHRDWGISLGNIGTGNHLWGISRLGNKGAGEHRDWEVKGLGNAETGKHRAYLVGEEMDWGV